MPAAVLDVSDYYVVLRPFTALGRILERGEVVEAAQWRNIQPLINRRYLGTPWSLEGRAALPVDHELTMELRLPETVGDEANGETPLPVHPEHRRPGRPRREI